MCRMPEEAPLGERRQGTGDNESSSNEIFVHVGSPYSRALKTQR